MLKEKIAENLLRWQDVGKGAPIQLTLILTNKCNLICKSCWKRSKDDNSEELPVMELSEERLFSLISEAKDLGVISVELTGGGEPLLRPTTAMRIMELVKKSGMIGWLTTNGTLFSQDLVRNIIEIAWDKVTFSIDGPDAQLNDFLRPPQGSFDKVIAALELFKITKEQLHSIYPAITMNIVVTKYNFQRLAEMVELANKYNVAGVTFEPIKLYSPSCQELMIDFEQSYACVNEQLIKAQELATKYNIFTNIDVMRNSPELLRYSGKLLVDMPLIEENEVNSFLSSKVPCYEPWFHIRVDADGSVSHCCVNPDIGENIRNNTLSNIWLGDNFNNFRQSILTQNYPVNCNLCNANLAFFSREISAILEKKLERRKTNIKVSKRKLKLLVTDTAPLYPPLWGGPKRIWNLYSGFDSNLFDIVYVGISFDIHNERNYSLRRIGDNFTEILCGLPRGLYPPWHAFEKMAFKNLHLDLFVYLWVYLDWHFRYILNSQRADVVVFSHPWSALAVNREPFHNQVFVYDAHNCEYLLMEQILQKHFLSWPVLAQTKRIEKNACMKSDIIAACSDKEKDDLIRIYNVSAEKIAVIPNGTNIRLPVSVFEKRQARSSLGLSPEDKIVVFIGAYYKPNIEATEQIVKFIAPQTPEFKFLIVGTVDMAFKLSEVPKNVIFIGQASPEKMHQVLSSADLAINPMLHGSGINIKMLDYMSYGLPVVASECGVRGIENKKDKVCFVASIKDFPGYLRQIMSDHKLSAKLSESGLKLVKEQYDWNMLSGQLQELILSKVILHK